MLPGQADNAWQEKLPRCRPPTIKRANVMNEDKKRPAELEHQKAEAARLIGEPAAAAGETAKEQVDQRQQGQQDKALKTALAQKRRKPPRRGG